MVVRLCQSNSNDRQSLSKDFPKAQRIDVLDRDNGKIRDDDLSQTELSGSDSLFDQHQSAAEELKLSTQQAGV